MSAALSKKTKEAGLNAFSAAVQKRSNPLRVARDLTNGQFAARTPITDPEAMEHCVRQLRAIRDLMAPLRGLTAAFADDPERVSEGAHFLAVHVAAFLDAWKASLLDAMVLDEQAVRRGTNPRVEPSYAHLSDAQRLETVVDMRARAAAQGLFEEAP